MQICAYFTLLTLRQAADPSIRKLQRLEGAVIYGDATRWWNVQFERRSATKSPSRVHVCHTAQFTREVRQSHIMQGTEGGHSELELDPLRHA